MKALAPLVILAFVFVLAMAQDYNNHGHYYQPSLRDKFVCTVGANYGLYGKERRRKNHPVPSFCVDTTSNSGCQKCCRMAAHIQYNGIKKDDVIGFVTIDENTKKCVCCVSQDNQSSYNNAHPTPY